MINNQIMMRVLVILTIPQNLNLRLLQTKSNLIRVMIMMKALVILTIPQNLNPHLLPTENNLIRVMTMGLATSAISMKIKKKKVRVRVTSANLMNNQNLKRKKNQTV